MAKSYGQLDERLKTFISEQKIFFVASAAGDGRVNLSPKGYDTLRVLDGKRLLYLDYPGSDNDTARHIDAGGNITIMFASFGEKPLILRLFGRGEAVPKEAAYFDDYWTFFPTHDRSAVRQMIVITADEIETSCGFGVPRFRFEGDRDDLERWATKNATKAGRFIEKLKGVFS